jgi:putative hydrolase of the HAD superfamily
LKKKYRLFLLSNTNSIHLKGVNEILSGSTNYNNLSSIFEQCYYSFEMKMRKPDPNIYGKVLEENGLNPLETLFIDDTIENTIGAASLGIKTIYLCHPLTLKEALREYV